MGYARDDRRWATATTPPLALDFESMADRYFHPEGVSADILREDLGPPTFFHKIVVVRCDDAAQDRAAEAAAGYFSARRKKQSEIDGQKIAVPSASGSGRQDEVPAWLTWKNPAAEDIERLPVEELAQRARPQVLASYNNDMPMLVRRQWGLGQVLFLTTSLSPAWTTMPDLPQSAWLMDRIARCLLAETLPAWNVSSEKGLVLPVALGDRSAHFTLVDPAGKEQPLSVDALGGERYGISLDDLTRRGIYRVRAQRGDNGGAGGAGGLLWEIPLAVNGPAEESELVPPKASEGAKGFVDVSAEVFSASPLELEGIDLWKWLVGLVLALLLAEFLLAARSTTRGEAAS